LEDTARDLVRKGRRYAVEPVDIQRVAALGEASGRQDVLFQGLQREAAIVDSTGQVVSTDAEQPSKRIFTLTWTPQGWKVVGIGDPRA
jgi:hypothetical protein